MSESEKVVASLSLPFRLSHPPPRLLFPPFVPLLLFRKFRGDNKRTKFIFTCQNRGRLCRPRSTDERTQDTVNYSESFFSPVIFFRLIDFQSRLSPSRFPRKNLIFLFFFFPPKISASNTCSELLTRHNSDGLCSKPLLYFVDFARTKIKKGTRA